ncbi:hypothetical protein [Pantoea sp. C2G6]|uniref:hypothetical protein n=1 Tax=Pantoea sp. C2G6 TaxID=3243084 RepID=UPI003EDA12D1
MYLARYIKSLFSSIKYYYDKLDAWKNYVALIATGSVLYYSIDPFEKLKEYESYKPTFFILLAFVVLFMAGYRSWKEQFEKNVKEDSIVLAADCSTSLMTTWKLGVKFGH